MLGKVVIRYSHLSNKRGGGAKVAKSLNVERGINIMAFPVMEFQDQGYKIRNIFA